MIYDYVGSYLWYLKVSIDSFGYLGNFPCTKILTIETCFKSSYFWYHRIEINLFQIHCILNILNMLICYFFKKIIIRNKFRYRRH